MTGHGAPYPSEHSTGTVTTSISSDGTNTRRDRKRLRTEELILDAATSVFLNKGMSTTTMQDIAQSADVAQGTLYNYFPNKESLTVAVARRMIKEHGRRLLEQELARGELNSIDIIVFATVQLINRGITDPFWRALVDRYDVFADALHDELQEFAMLNMKKARRLNQLSGTDELLANYWRTGAWVISGAIRDITLGRVGAEHRYTFATLTLMKMGIGQAQARATVRRIRSRLEHDVLDASIESTALPIEPPGN
jgi:AcrR family transcriptional regulator